MLFSMIVVMTSWAPVLARSHPGNPPQIAPPAIPASSASGRWRKIGIQEKEKPTMTAVIPPMSIWPSAPMLNRPARKPIPTARPAKMSGAAAVRVSDTARRPPNDPCHSAT